VGQQDKSETACVEDTPSCQDKLSYLSDIIRELTTISDNLGCTTLTGLLEVASREADIQSRYGRSPGHRRN
jgi:hypothetical protein